MSESLNSSLIKSLSYELIRVTPLILTDALTERQSGKFVIGLAMKRLALKLLNELGTTLKNLLSTEEAFKILVAANEPFKKTRRRLPPQAENELATWLDVNRSHPYPTDDFIEDFCEKYDGIEPDQVRIFLTNSRRKMTEGVRKRLKTS